MIENVLRRPYVIEQVVAGIPLGNHFCVCKGRFVQPGRETTFRTTGEAESCIREFGLGVSAKVSRLAKLSSAL